MTFKELLKQGVADLTNNAQWVLDGDDPLKTARQLLIGLLNWQPIDVWKHGEEEANPDIITKFKDSILRYSCGEPMAYILGHTWFYGLKIAVGKGVLIPRPDTELLVSKGVEALRLLADKMATLWIPNVLELCTGSACISLALRKLWGRPIRIIATDLSSEALMYAKRNISIHDADQEIDLYQGDLFAALPNEVNPNDKMFSGFDLILANPPYIQSEILKTLEKGVKDYEPRIALDGGNDGLNIYRRICSESALHLKPGGYLLLEHGYDQKIQLLEMFKKNRAFINITDEQDLSGRDRVLQAIKRDD